MEKHFCRVCLNEIEQLGRTSDSPVMISEDEEDKFSAFELVHCLSCRSAIGKMYLTNPKGKTINEALFTEKTITESEKSKLYQEEESVFQPKEPKIQRWRPPVEEFFAFLRSTREEIESIGMEAVKEEEFLNEVKRKMMSYIEQRVRKRIL